jgi:Circularly permutated YpsA SLOG family
MRHRMPHWQASSRNRIGSSCTEACFIILTVRIVLVADTRPMPLRKIVSGGQTGVDRAALDAALASQFPCGGWCPADRSAEDGIIPATYPVTPLPDGGLRKRTRQNVTDSDGTLIVCDPRLTAGELTGGTQLTWRVAKEHGRPLLVIDASKFPVASAAEAIIAWINTSGIGVLNVAGPRESGWPEAYAYTRGVIEMVLESVCQRATSRD